MKFHSGAIFLSFWFAYLLNAKVNQIVWVIYHVNKGLYYLFLKFQNDMITFYDIPYRKYCHANMNIQYEVKFCLIKKFSDSNQKFTNQHRSWNHLLKVSPEAIKFLISCVTFSGTEERQKV